MNKKSKLEKTISFAKTLDALPYYALLIDSEHNILFANKATRSYFDKKMDEMIGSYCPKAIHGKDQPIDECPLEDCVKTNQFIEKEIYDSDTKLWLLSSIYPTGMKTDDGKEIYLHQAIDITAKKKAEKIVEEQRKELIQKNNTLKDILEHITVEKNEIKEKMVFNLNKLIIPKLKHLNKKGDISGRKQIEFIQKDIENIASSFGKEISKKELTLSPREIEICDMIRNGLTNKKMAKELSLSIKTIETIRRNIRKKVKINNKKINLQIYLQSIE